MKTRLILALAFGCSLILTGCSNYTTEYTAEDGKKKNYETPWKPGGNSKENFKKMEKLAWDALAPLGSADRKRIVPKEHYGTVTLSLSSFPKWDINLQSLVRYRKVVRITPAKDHHHRAAYKKSERLGFVAQPVANPTVTAYVFKQMKMDGADMGLQLNGVAHDYGSNYHNVWEMQKQSAVLLSKIEAGYYGVGLRNPLEKELEDLEKEDGGKYKRPGKAGKTKGKARLTRNISDKKFGLDNLQLHKYTRSKTNINASHILKDAELSFRKGEYRHTINAAVKLNKFATARGVAAYLKIMAYLELGEQVKAVKVFENAVTTLPVKELAIPLQALYPEKQDALTLLSSVRPKQKKSDHKLMSLYGFLLLIGGDDEGSGKIFKHVKKIAPHYAPVKILLGENLRIINI